MPPQFLDEENLLVSFSIPYPTENQFHGGIDLSQGIKSVELMPGVLKSLKIRTQVQQLMHLVFMERRDGGGGQHAWASFTVNPLRL
jgi:hypothetical protein